MDWCVRMRATKPRWEQRVDEYYLIAPVQNKGNTCDKHA